MTERPHRFSQLDDRALPLVAGALRGLAGAAGAIVGRRSVFGRVLGSWIRREPVIVIAVGSIAFAAVLIAATGGDDQSPVRPSTVAAGPAAPSAGRLGPAPGASVASYLAAAATRRDGLRTLGASQRIDALVDLTSYISPLAVDTLLAATPDVAVVRGFARVPPPVEASVHVLVTSPQANLAVALSAAQASASQVAAHYKSEVTESLASPSPQLSDEIDAGAAAAAEARVDAAGLSSDCGCVFALIVSGPVSQIEDLAGAAAVRVLDPAPVGVSLDSLLVVPLEPQDTKRVSELAYAGD
ncbi:MAG TPA: hypothetical protein VG899_14950 [Mycobacteriales bacterium]|nr:hypothetical protein [Mycobacteriales bacterium]